MANFPLPKELWSERNGGRGQRKFVTKESAESFIEEARREWVRSGRIELARDASLHYDLLRAVRVLVRSGVRNWSLERCARVYLQCCALAEIPGREMRYEVARDRSVTLSPRMFLLVEKESGVRGVSLVEALEGMLAEAALGRADRAIRQATRDERRELEELESRNAVEKKRLLEIENEREIRRKLQGIDMIYEAGRRSVLDKRNEYQRWRYGVRKRERARVAQERSDLRANGS